MTNESKQISDKQEYIEAIWLGFTMTELVFKAKNEMQNLSLDVIIYLYHRLNAAHACHAKED